MSHAIASTAGRAALERRLAALLKYGTWLASLMIAAGFVLAQGASYTRLGPAASACSMHIAAAGIVLFILLPVLRLILMLGVFLHQRDYRLSVVTLLVLLIVLAACVIGAYMRGAVAS
jgi:Protein of unknown function (DUF1634)